MNDQLVKVTFLASAILTIPLGANASSSCVVPPSGMESWWSADDAFDRARDIKGQNDGTAWGVEYAAGKVGAYAFSFAGSQDNYLLVLNDQATMEHTSAFTVDAWVRADTTPGPFRYLVAKGAQACEAASFGLYTGTGGGLQFYIYDGSNYHMSAPIEPGAVWDGQWHLVAATYQASDDGNEGASVIRLYLDHTLISETAVSSKINYDLSITDLSIGGYLGCSLPFQGDIDEVELFHRALALSEISALYYAGDAGKCQRKVAIDVMPASTENKLNLGSAGVIPVVIFSDEGFDATQLDPLTVELNGAQVKLVGNKLQKPLCHANDVDADGLPDLVCQVYTVDFLLEEGQSEAILKAQTLGDVWVYGSDAIEVVGQ